MTHREAHQGGGHVVENWRKGGRPQRRGQGGQKLHRAVDLAMNQVMSDHEHSKVVVIAAVRQHQKLVTKDDMSRTAMGGEWALVIAPGTKSRDGTGQCEMHGLAPTRRRDPRLRPHRPRHPPALQLSCVSFSILFIFCRRDYASPSAE